jgi:hypothetical protein
VKIDLFNNVVKTALPNFDNLMTAAWNVVYVHKNVGSEDRELYKSITTLEKVLLEFTAFHRKVKTKPEPPEKSVREQPLPNNAHKGVPSGSTLASSLTGASNGDAQHRSQVHIAELAHNDEESAEEDVSRPDAHNHRTNFRSGRHAAEYEAQIEPNAGQRTQEQNEAVVARRVEKLRGQLANTRKISVNGGGMHRSDEDSLCRVLVDEGSGYTDNEQPQHTNNAQREQQRTFNSQREQPSIPPDPRNNLPQDQQYVSVTQKANHLLGKPTREPHRQVYTDGLNEYFEDIEQATRVSNVARSAPPTPAVFLGHSKLGAPKVPPNAVGSAPVAPMMHTRKEGGGERSARPMS